MKKKWFEGKNFFELSGNNDFKILFNFYSTPIS